MSWVKEIQGHQVKPDLQKLVDYLSRPSVPYEHPFQDCSCEPCMVKRRAWWEATKNKKIEPFNE